MTSVPFGPLVWKEVRGLSTPWLASVIALLIAGAGHPRIWLAGMLTYLIGAVALGALSVGQEFNLRTLTAILSQPVSRGRLYAIKLTVLVPMMCTLALAAWVFLLTGSRADSLIGDQTGLWWLILLAPALCGLLVAPAVTMLCRNPIAGIVFTIAAPFLMWFAADIVVMIRHGVSGSTIADTAAFRVEVLQWGLGAICVLAGAASWPLFARLEAVDGSSAGLRFPALVRRRETASLSKRNPLWLLLAKELRVQQLTLAVTALFLLSWFAILSVPEWTIEFRTGLLFALITLHSGAVVLLSGSLASAEERQLATVGWQTLLPMATWKQWLMKVGTAIGLTVILGFGVPALLVSFRPFVEAEQLGTALSSEVLLTALGITTVSLYISSLCSSGLRALLLGLPVLLALTAFVSIVSTPLARMFGLRYDLSWVSPTQRLFRDASPRLLPYMESRDVFLYYALPVLPSLILLVSVVLLLRFGLVNHRSAERGTRRVVMQLGLMAATLALGVSLWFGGERVYRSGLERASEQWERELLEKNPRLRELLEKKNRELRR